MTSDMHYGTANGKSLYLVVDIVTTMTRKQCTTALQDF